VPNTLTLALLDSFQTLSEHEISVMAEEETPIASRASRSRKGKRPAESAGKPPTPPPPAPPRPIEATTLLRRLAGRPAAEVLGRISDGDPLRLYPSCAYRISERYFSIDPDRVFERALATVAVSLETEPENCDQAEWLVEKIDRAIRYVLKVDQEEDRSGPPPDDEFLDPRYRVFVEAFGVEPPLARTAAVRFNGLDERVRKGFFHLLVYGESVETCVNERALAPPQQLRRDVLTALWALGHLDDAGLEEMLNRKKRQKKEKPEP
jgi:hypothetical protein